MTRHFHSERQRPPRMAAMAIATHAGSFVRTRASASRHGWPVTRSSCTRLKTLQWSCAADTMVRLSEVTVSIQV